MGDNPPATHEGVAHAKSDFNDSLRRLRSAARTLDAKSSNPLDLLTKVRFSEEELRSLIRMTLDKDLKSDTVSKLISAKYHDLAEKYDAGTNASSAGPTSTPDKAAKVEVKESSASTAGRSKTGSEAKRFFDICQVPDSEVSKAQFWDQLTFEDLLRCNPFLRYLTYQQIQALENSMTLESLPASEIIANEGDPLPFGMIRSGKVEVLHKTANGEEESCLILESGDIFGYEFVDFHEGAEPEAVARNIYRVHEQASIYFCSMATVNRTLYTEQDDISHWISKALDMWCRSFSRATIDHQHRHAITELLLLWQTKLPSIDRYLDLLERLEILYSSISPDLNFRDNLEDLILKLRPIFNCDRCSFYTLDTPNNLMYLFTVDVSKTVDRLGSEHYDNSNQLYGLRMPMKGIAAQVAKTGRPVNLVDCYMSEFFDSAMDIRTGYLSKQMLCVPVLNRAGDTIGVIQFINTTHDHAFTAHDEILASFLSVLMGPVLCRTQLRDVSLSQVKPSTMLFANNVHQASSSSFAGASINLASLTGNCNVSINFHRLLTIAEHRHIKFTVRCVEYGNDIVTMRTSIMFAALPHAEDVKIVELNTPMQFSKLEYGRLTPSSYLLVEFFSKNNHPCGWTIFPFYDGERYLRHGVMDVPVFYGNCPPDWLFIGTIFSTAQRMGLYDRDDTTDRSVFLSGICSGSLLLELHPEQGPSNASSAASYGTQRAPTTFYHEFPFALPPCHFSAYTLHRQMVHTTNGEASTWTIPEWLMTLQLPEAKRRKLATALCAHFMILSTETLAMNTMQGRTATTTPNNPHLSTLLDPETQQFLWEHRDTIQHRVPQLFAFCLFTMDWSLLDRQQWLLSTLHKWNRLTVAHLLPLLDVRFGNSPLQAFATSSLWTLSSAPLYLLRFFFATLSQAQMSSDTSLHRFLQYRMYADVFPSTESTTGPSPWPFAVPFIWQLWSIDHFHSFAGLKDQLLMQSYMRMLPKDQRAFIANGLLFFQDVHNIYANFVTQGRFNFPAMAPGMDPSIGQEAVHAVIQDFREALTSLWHGDKPWLLPLGSLVTHAAHSPNIYHLTTPPVITGIEDVRMGSYYGKESFIFHLSPNPAQQLPPVGLIYLPHVNYRLEHIHSQLINVMNFILMDKQVPLSLMQQEIYPLAFDRVGNQCKEAIATYVPGVVSLNFLIVDAMKAFQKANKTQNMFQIRKQAEPVMTKIPDDLLLAFYAANVNDSLRNNRAAMAEEMEHVIHAFMPNLAGFLLTSYVLSMQGVNTSTTFVDHFGTLFARNITSLMGVDASVYNGTSTGANNPSSPTPKSKTPKRQSIFYLPCFLETIGGVQGGLYRDFQQLLLSSFRALRDHAPLLLWTIRTVFIAHEMPLEDMQAAVISVRETLMLDVTDDIASQQFQETLQRGLKADYQLKVK